MTLAVALYLGLLAHLVGDYLLQSHWMASEKTRRWWPAVLHALTYGLPFVFITQHVGALAVIVGTHLLIDRYRLARYVVWLKNQQGPARFRPAWDETANGYPASTPLWLGWWLLIIADNTLHLIINTLALAWAIGT